MQKAKVMEDFVLLPVPKEVAEELGLDPFTIIQYTVSKGRLIVELVDAEQCMVCFSGCCHCPGSNCFESAGL